MEQTIPEKKNYVINIESNRLLLRNILPKDKNFIIDLWTNSDVTEYMGGHRDRNKMNIDVQENIDNPFQDEYDLWILVDKATETSIGHCGLLKKDVEGIDETEVIYVIDIKFWGKGYATEIAHMLIDYAFKVKKLNSVIALIKPQNTASEKVASNIGMRLEKEIIRQGNIPMLLYRKENDKT